MILHWPQLTYLALTVLGLGVVVAKHGEPKFDRNGDVEKHNAILSTVFTAVILFLLFKGGFFG